MLFANGRRAKTLLSCLVLIIANLPLRSEPVAALAYKEYPAPRGQEAVQHLSNERNAPVLSGIRVAQAWWTIAGQRETHDSDSASLGRKQRRARNRQRIEPQRETSIVTDKISTNMVFDVPLSPEDRAEIWRALSEQAARTSIPAGLRVGDAIPSTTHLLSFPDNLRNRVPAIFRFSFTLLHDEVLIVDPRSKAVVFIVAK
jgi:hypothetical protein